MHIFHTTSGFKRPNISRNTHWNFNFPLPYKNLPLKLQVIQTPFQNLGRNSFHWVLNISYFSQFTLNISGQQCMGVLKLLWPGKPALWVWQRNYHVQTVSFTKNYCSSIFGKTTILQSLEAFLFQMNGDKSKNSIDLILVGKFPLSVIWL